MTLFREFAWPVLVGVVLACLYLQHQKSEKLQEQVDLLVSTFPASSTPPPENAPEAQSFNSYAAAVEKAMPAVVNIFSKKTVKERLAIDPLVEMLLEGNIAKRTRVENSLGSGVLVRSDGYLLTNYHLIEGASEILVSLRDGRETAAHLVGSDKETDLAVLKIEMTDLPVIEFSDPQHARIGDVVLAIGNPFGIGLTVTQGIISAAARYGLELSIQENYLQTDAAINEGNSGGALVDVHGKLLGINTAIQSPSGGSVGIGYAMPADTARKVLDDILIHGRVVRGWIGIEYQGLDEFMSVNMGLDKGQGILVRNIFQNSPAAQAGLVPGDIITHFDGVPASATRAGMKQIAHAKPGEKVLVRFLRARTVHEVDLTIGVRPGA